MMRVPVIMAALLLGACGQSSPQQQNAATTQVAPKPAAPAAKPADCAPAPRLSLSPDFADPRREYGPGSKSFAVLQTNFADAYAKACASGILKGHPLVDSTAPHPGQLFLKGAPDANVASIYQQSADGVVPGDMVLEYYFITADGQLHVPSSADLGEAIHCTVHGANSAEEQDSGRCLPD